jgi:hypothetical protein
MNIEATKLELIKLIAEEQSERILEQVQAFFKQAATRPKTGTAKLKKANDVAAKHKPSFSNGNGKSDLLALSAEPIPHSVDIEQLKKDQGYDTIEMFEHFRNLDRKAWKDENLVELLELLRH